MTHETNYLRIKSLLRVYNQFKCESLYCKSNSTILLCPCKSWLNILLLNFIFADVILPVINSSVDSPIATAECTSDQQRTGNGNFEFQSILRDVREFLDLHNIIEYNNLHAIL